LATEDAVAKYALSHIDLIIQVDRHIDENNNRTFSAEIKEVKA
jgi:hypothetical protein